MRSNGRASKVERRTYTLPHRLARKTPIHFIPFIPVNLSISPDKLSGLTAIVSRANAAEGAEPTTPEAYLLARVEEILASYDAQEVERVKQAAAPLFDLAATLPVEAQEQIKQLVQQLAQT
jgi:hypothetical protein